MKLLPALTDTTKALCLTWGSCGPMSQSYYAYLFSITAGREVTPKEAMAIIDEHNYRVWVQEGCPQRTRYSDIIRSETAFWRNQ